VLGDQTRVKYFCLISGGQLTAFEKKKEYRWQGSRALSRESLEEKELREIISTRHKRDVAQRKDNWAAP